MRPINPFQDLILGEWFETVLSSGALKPATMGAFKTSQ